MPIRYNALKKDELQAGKSQFSAEHLENDKTLARTITTGANNHEAS